MLFTERADDERADGPTVLVVSLNHDGQLSNAMIQRTWAFFILAYFQSKID